MSTNRAIERIVRESGVPDLLEVLSERLAPTDLQSLLLEVAHRRAAAVTPARLLEQYEHNRLVRPSGAAPELLLAFDSLALSLAAPRFEPLELSPLCPLGTNSAVATVDQNQAVSTLRNTEVVSDATNVLALECALRRRAAQRSGDAARQVRLCASHRLMRPQTSVGPGTFSHFRLFGMSSAGRDTGAGGFELAALREHLALYLGLLGAAGQIGLDVRGLRVTLTPLGDTPRRDLLEQDVLAALGQQFGDVELGFDEARASGRGYYRSVCFHVYARDGGGTEHNIVDGGFTGWTQQLLSNRKERLLISGIGSERVCSVFGPAG